MKQPISGKQLKAIALGEAIKTLVSTKENLRDRLTHTDTLGNRIAVHFDDSDEQQEAYNRTLDMIVVEFDAIIEKHCQDLLKIGRF